MRPVDCRAQCPTGRAPDSRSRQRSAAPALRVLQELPEMQESQEFSVRRACAWAAHPAAPAGPFARNPRASLSGKRLQTSGKNSFLKYNPRGSA